MTDVRRAFEAARTFPLDPFQLSALDAIDAGRSVLVVAPTGSGKTVVAEYAIARALAGGAKAFYTTPLKALSNQKYGDLVREHGAPNVGLLTGDNSVNGEAPAVVMTTEVLRNMIYAHSPALVGLRWVVLDEVHYLQNQYRGAVWEEVIIHLPREVGLICLSATVSNAEELADWLRTVRGDTTVVIEEQRAVELTNYYLVEERGGGALALLPTFTPGEGGEPRPNPDAARLDARGGGDRGRRHGGRRGPPGRRSTNRGLRPPRRSDYAELLAHEDMLPAIVFVFSRAGCDQAVQQCVAAGLRLTDAGERAAIRRIADARTESLSDADLAVLRGAEWREGLECGFAAHHAGMVPPMKEAVEEAFAAGLVKVVFATETLSLGINMPARSVVIEKLSKFTGERHEFLTPGEYTQLTGRAGRRGIDDIGYAVVCWSPFVPFEKVSGVASRRASALTSSFRPTYNMAANLVDGYEPERAHQLLNLSFAQYRADRDVVALERRLERDRALLAGHAAEATCDRGDVAEYRSQLAEAKSTRRHAGERSRRPAAVDPDAHPVAACPDRGRHLRAAFAAARVERDLTRLTRRVRGRNQTLARQFDQVLRVLEAWGFTDGWALTGAGRLLMRLYSECDILVAAGIRSGLLDGLGPSELAAVTSCLTFARRGADGAPPRAPARWPTTAVGRRYRELERIWRELANAEDDAGLSETRAPDPGLTAAMYEWAEGDDLAVVLEDDDELTGGDFVRNVKQCIDLLRQIGDVAPDRATATAARTAADRCFRGVVAASSVVP
ncbi:MAG TPA: DEAD/DEAH box helicase [Acidimicrobiia bacterium]|nr:DEAD/DEAH box helicase [Acidimicrobiia bacterium]